MDNPMRERGERRQLADQAAEWLFRLEAASPEERRAFVRWLKSSKDAPDEVLLAKSTDILLRQLLRDRPVDLADFSLGTNNVTPLPVALDPATPAPFSSAQSGERSPSSSSEIALATEAKTRVRGRRQAWIGGMGVSIAAAIALFMIEPPFVSQWLHPDVYRTSIGEQRSVELNDGSAISINARSSVRVKFTKHARDVYLNAGQAMFTVAKDANRPFRVHVNDSVVQAIGTKFDVRRGTDRISVAVVEGTVQITTEAAANHAPSALATLAAVTRVTAGEAVSVADAGRITPPKPINVADISAWQQRRLVFADNTLAEIAEEFARFNRTPQLRIEGEALRARRFSGVFDADAPEALLAYLSDDESIVFDRQADEIVIMPRPIIVQSSGNAP